MNVSTASGENFCSGTSKARLLCGKWIGKRGSISARSIRGEPPTALSRFAASVRCSISSMKTLRTTSAASTLCPSLIEYRAQR
jgi:hypothetical protein